jgi:hypothetical protein
VSTIEELLEGNSSGSGLENLEYGRVDPSRLQRDTLYPQKLALTKPTSGGGSVGIVRSPTKAMELSVIITSVCAGYYEDFDCGFAYQERIILLLAGESDFSLLF